MLRSAGVGLVFFALALISVAATRATEGFALIWPANGIAAALLIRMRQVSWITAALAILLAGLAANVLAGDPWPTAASLTLVNLIEIAMMVIAFRFVWPLPYPRLTIFQASFMTVVMGVIITGFGALLGSAFLHFKGDAPLWTTLKQWWLSDALGACVFVPLVVLYSRSAVLRLVQARYVARNALTVLACIGMTGIVIRYVEFPFVVIALLPMVAAFQVGAFGTALLSACNVLTVIVLWTQGVRPEGLFPAGADHSLHALPFIALIATVLPPIAVGLGTDARRQITRALRASEQRFRESMEHSPLGMIILDRNGGWSYTNPAMQRMLGYSDAEMSSLNIESLAHPEELHDIWTHWGRLLAGQIDSYTIERRFQHKRGDWIWVTCAVSLARDEDGMPMHFVAQVESLEERRQAAARLADEKELLRVTLAAIGDAVITVSAEGRVTYMNAAAVELTGWPSVMAERRRLAEVLPLTDPDSQTPVPMLLDASRTEGGPARRDEPCALARADRTVRYVSDVVTPVLDCDNRLLGYVAVVRDLTDAVESTRDLERRANHDPLTNLLNRAEFERRLNEAAEQWREHGTSSSLIVTDLDRFKSVNDTGGHAAGDAVLRHVAAVLQGSVRPTDAVGRLGGDEFAVLLRGCGEERAREIATRVLGSLNPLVTRWDGVDYTTGASIGVAQYSEKLANAGEWVAAADAVCYESKRAGRGRLRIA